VEAARAPDDERPRADVRAHARLDPPDAAAARLAERKLAVWSGDYYALEVMQQLGLPDGAVRVGLVHYNTEQEVDRLLEGLAEL
jgi:selenocysteine lyase/cysteine desulfurase